MFFIHYVLCISSFCTLLSAADTPQWGGYIASWWGTSEPSTTITNTEASPLTEPDNEPKNKEDPSDWQNYFIKSTDHNPLMSPEIRQKLIDKGYTIIQNLIAKKEISHTIDIFINAGRNFVEASWFQDLPTLKSFRKGMNKSIAWAHSWWNATEIDAEALEKQKTLNRRAYLESIIAVIWALADHAARLKYCEPHLVMTIKDPEAVLWELVNLYAEQCKQDSYATENSFAYITQQTVDENAQTILGSWTIDARFESTSWALPVLPYNNNALIVARILPDQFNIAPEKTLCALTYKNEGISAWIYKTTETDIADHQKSRKEYGKAYATILHDFIRQEGTLLDDKLLNTKYTAESKAGIIGALDRIAQDRQTVHFGILARIAEYIERSSVYSSHTHTAARDFLFFLKNSCGDPIDITEEEIRIHPLVSYRISTELLADLSEMPLKKNIAIEVLAESKPSSEEIHVNEHQKINNDESITKKETIEASFEEKKNPIIEEENTPSKEVKTPHTDENKVPTNGSIAELFHAIEKENIKKISALLEEKKDLINTPNLIDKTSKEYGSTPLHHAAYLHNTALIQTLLKNGADVSAQDAIGRTPLYIAYQFTKTPIIEILIDAHSPINTTTNFKESIIHLALRRLDYQMLTKFLNKGGSLEHNKTQEKKTFSILLGIIQDAQKSITKNQLPRDILLHENKRAILKHPNVKNFCIKRLQKFPLPYKAFLENLYATEQ